MRMKHTSIKSTLIAGAILWSLAACQNETPKEKTVEAPPPKPLKLPAEKTDSNSKVTCDQDRVLSKKCAHSFLTTKEPYVISNTAIIGMGFQIMTVFNSCIVSIFNLLQGVRAGV